MPMDKYDYNDSDDDDSDDYDYDDDDEDERHIYCYCQGMCPFEDDEGICKITTPGGKCFAVKYVDSEPGDTEYTNIVYGCLEQNQMAILQCRASHISSENKNQMQCCDESDFCNKNMFPSFMMQNKILIIIASSFISCLIVLFLVFLTVYNYRRRCLLRHIETNNKENINTNIIQTNFRSLNVLEITSGSGSGLPQMAQRTIAKQIEMENIIGKGRYAEVWRAKWRGEKVAAKIFLSTQEKSWSRETDVYKTFSMRHDNILGFICADIKSTGDCTQLLLITDYHENGSLFDYLKANTLNIDLCLSMCLGIAKGLTHLHTEIIGVPGKPPIAHRDIKSKNILVKTNLECCIADFGLAVKYDAVTKTVDAPLTDRSGTKRYMAPEILSNTINLENFNSYKMTDIYAFALVLWEISRRCNLENQPALEYEIPYLDTISAEMDFEEIQNVICVNKIRPTIPEFWREHPVMKVLAKLMQEMWHDNPGVRLTSLRVKKTIDQLIANYATINARECEESK